MDLALQRLFRLVRQYDLGLKLQFNYEKDGDYMIQLHEGNVFPDWMLWRLTGLLSTTNRYSIHHPTPYNTTHRYDLNLDFGTALNLFLDTVEEDIGSSDPAPSGKAALDLWLRRNEWLKTFSPGRLNNYVIT